MFREFCSFTLIFTCTEKTGFSAFLRSQIPLRRLLSRQQSALRCFTDVATRSWRLEALARSKTKFLANLCALSRPLHDRKIDLWPTLTTDTVEINFQLLRQCIFRAV